MNIFDKLMLAKQLTFKEGNIILLGNRVVIFNANLFAEYTKRINDSPDMVSIFYGSVKYSFGEFAKEMGTEYKFTFKDFFKWMTDLAELTGWGIFTWQEIDEVQKKGSIFVQGSPIVERLKGQVKTPIDHVIRGFIAGGASAAFNADIDVYEEECEALGALKCRFIMKPADKSK